MLPVLLALLMGLASTEHPGATLVVEHSEATRQCASRAAIARGVSSRLGYSPWRDDGEWTLVVRTGRRGAVLVADLAWMDRAERVRARRHLESKDRTCAELGAQVEVAISVAMATMVPRPPPPSPSRPRYWMRILPLPPAPAPEEPPRDIVESDVVAPPPTEAAPWWRAAPRVSSGTRLVLDVGTLASPTWGVAAHAGLGVRNLLGAVEIRALQPVTRRLVGGSLMMQAAVASLLACVEERVLQACGTASAGALVTTGDGLVKLRGRVFPQAALGARVGAGLPLNRFVSLVGALEGSLVLVRARLLVERTEVWHAPPVALQGSLGLTFTLQ